MNSVSVTGRNPRRRLHERAHHHDDMGLGQWHDRRNRSVPGASEQRPGAVADHVPDVRPPRSDLCSPRPIPTVSWSPPTSTTRSAGVTRSIRADGTATRMTYAACATYGCENGDPGSGATGINKTVVVASERNIGDSQIRDSRTYLDQFDRPIVQKSMTATGGYSRSGTQYNALGQLYRQTAPCDAASCTAYWVTNTYDLAGRVATQSRPQSQSVSTPVTTTFRLCRRHADHHRSSEQDHRQGSGCERLDATQRGP